MIEKLAAMVQRPLFNVLNQHVYIQRSKRGTKESKRLKMQNSLNRRNEKAKGLTMEYRTEKEKKRKKIYKKGKRMNFPNFDLCCNTRRIALHRRFTKSRPDCRV